MIPDESRESPSGQALPESNGGPVPIPAVRPGADHTRLARARAGEEAVPPKRSKASLEVEFLHAWKRRWLLATTVGILCAALAAVAAWRYFPPKYWVRALVYVATRQPGVLAPVGDELSDFTSYQRTQRVLLKSQAVLGAALQELATTNPDLVDQHPDGVTWLDDALKVEVIAPEVLGVSIGGSQPEALGTVLSTVLRVYLEIARRTEVSRQEGRLEQLTTLAADCRNKLSRKEALLDTLAKRAGTGDLATLGNRHRLVLEQLAAVERELRQPLSELSNPEAEAGRTHGMFTASEASRFHALFSDSKQRDRVLAQFAQRKAELLQAIREAKLALRPDKQGPFLEKYQRELQTVEAETRAREQELRSVVEVEMRSTASTPPAVLAIPRPPPGTPLKDRQDFLRGEQTRLKEEARRLNDEQLELERLRKEIDHLEITRLKLTSEVDALQAERGAAARINLLEEPTPQPNKTLQRRLLATGIGGFAGFGIGLFGILWRDTRTRRLRTRQEVIQDLGLPVVGMLPCFPTRQPLPGVPGANARTLQYNGLLEHADATWARLFYATRADPFQVLLITSALPGEGKTFLTCQLALSLARTGRKTLLLDCDFRRPTAHRYFNLPVEPGIQEVLRGEISIHDAPRPTLYRGLSMLPAGKLRLDDDQALGREDQVRHILEELKKRYDFILVDSSPVLATADTLWLAQHVDAAVISLLYDISDFSAVEAAYAELGALGTRILGAVLGKMPKLRSRYYYSADARSNA